LQYIRRLVKALGILALMIVAYGVAENLTREWTVGWQHEQVATIQPPGDGEVSLELAGDVMMGWGVGDAINREADGDYRYPFRHVRSYLREADIAVANLESAVSDRGAPIAKRYVLRVPPQAIPALVDAGFDVLSLANNHVLDYGPMAAEDTGRLLSDAGIRWGALAPEGGRQEPVILTVRGVKIGFLFYCDPTFLSCAQEYLQFPVRPPFATEATLARDIRDLKTRADIAVVSIHWGTEHLMWPEDRTISRARWIIDQGADILMGHHTHTQQGVEFYKHGVIFYSLGNFVFAHGQETLRRIGRLYRVTVSANGIRNVLVLPIEIRRTTWDPFPLTSGYVSLKADSFRRRSELPGQRVWWRIWVPKFWKREYWQEWNRTPDTDSLVQVRDAAPVRRSQVSNSDR
jgi:poly-gamma-glutamate synthesis protein (capsule biosynthesis protein)